MSQHTYKIYFPLFDHGESRSNEMRLTHEGLLAHPRVGLVERPETADFLVFCQNHLVDHCPFHTQFRPIKDRFKERTILLDFDDDPRKVFDASDFRWKLYFKRSCVDKESGKVMDYGGLPIKPTAYCLLDGMARPPDDWDTVKRIDISCLFDDWIEDCDWCHKGRGRLLKFAKRLSANYRLKMQLGTVSESGSAGRSATDPRYKRCLYESKIVLHANPDPWEGDSRTWEALGAGALLFVDRMVAPIRNPLIDGRHLVYYDLSDDGMQVLEERLVHYLLNDRAREKIAHHGREFVLRHHRPIDRVNEIIEALDQAQSAASLSASVAGMRAAEPKANAIRDYDPRIKRLSQHRQFIIINNYKCGFSSSNLLAAEKVKSIASEDSIILFYRNIFLRAISVFINWCITDDRYRTDSGWLLRHMAGFLGDAEYRRFIRLITQAAFPQAFRIYVETLPHIFHYDNHTLPQTAILDYYGIGEVHYHVELENGEKFLALTNIRFPHERTNVSDRHIKQQLIECLQRDIEMQEKLRKIYAADLSYFNDRGIIVDSL